jgi:hypothetical protein
MGQIIVVAPSFQHHHLFPPWCWMEAYDRKSQHMVYMKKHQLHNNFAKLLEILHFIGYSLLLEPKGHVLFSALWATWWWQSRALLFCSCTTKESLRRCKIEPLVEQQISLPSTITTRYQEPLSWQMQPGVPLHIQKTQKNNVQKNNIITNSSIIHIL